ncbi:unnamed protein product [Chrysoparadoxa australica]
MSSTFAEARFKQRVTEAVAKVKTLLQNTRRPQYPADVQHKYIDKYLLVERLGALSIEALIAVFRLLGVDHALSTDLPASPFAEVEWLDQVKQWQAKGSSVTLRFASEQRCRFIKMKKRMVEDPRSSTTTVTSSSSWRPGRSTTEYTHRTKTEITEWFWTLEHSYNIVAYPGNRLDEAVTLVKRSTSVELITTVKDSPKPEVNVFEPIEVEVTLLLKLLSAEGTFTIDRALSSCHTPRRNADVDSLYGLMRQLIAWSIRVKSYFEASVFPVQPNNKLNLGAINTGEAGIWCPVVPLLEEAASEDASLHLSLTDVAAMMQEQRRGLDEKLTTLRTTFKEGKGLISVHEAALCLLLQHVQTVAVSLRDGVDFVEFMLRQQIVAAIGKEVKSQDVDEYMKFHNRKLFAPEFAPRPFHFDVRRGPGFAPEGSLSIERKNPYSTEAQSQAEGPITTSVRVMDLSVGGSPPPPPMSFALNAATSVSFQGPHFLHGYIQHKFATEAVMQHTLVARARQFSSFILMVGRIAAPDLFEPMHAIVVKDKDEVVLPLLLDPLPTPKEFKDAIASLSPEQQRFAKAFRAMQLESTLFGVLVVQIKPQMEALLRLPAGSLAKEIQLTQDLMDLFITYQVPSDLVTYEGQAEVPVAEKVSVVKGHVKALQTMINAQKEQELAEQRQVAEASLLDSLASSCEDDMDECEEECCEEVPMERSRKQMKKKTKGRRGMKVMSSRAVGMKQMATSSMMMAASGAPPAPPAPAPGGPPGGPSGGAAELPSSTPLPPSTEQQLNEGAGREGAADADPTDQAPDGAVTDLDYTKVPQQLDTACEELDTDASLRPTTITVGKNWTRRSFKGLLRSANSSSLSEDTQRTEKSSAMDLIDALSRSGDLALNTCQLHVLLALTQCFDATVMDTLVQENSNPIERIERSSLIVAGTIHDHGAAGLLADDATASRIMSSSPQLFLET